LPPTHCYAKPDAETRNAKLDDPKVGRTDESAR
jgi:hypothetical protein